MLMEQLTKEEDKAYRKQSNKLRLGKKNKLSPDYGIVDIYKYWKTQYPEDKKRINYQLFRDIVKEYNKIIIHDILYKSRIYRMPFGLGQLKVIKLKMDLESLSNNLKTDEGPRLRIDWANTKKYNKRIYHLNDHKENYYYKFSWKYSKIPNKRYYSYTASRNIKRTLAKILKNNPEIDYVF